MFILGGLVLMLGACNTIRALLVPAEQLIQEQKAVMPPGQEMPFSAETMKSITVDLALPPCCSAPALSCWEPACAAEGSAAQWRRWFWRWCC